MLSCNLMVFICAFRFIFEKCVCLVVALNFMTLWHHEMPFVCEMFVFFLVGMCCWYAVCACMCVRVCARVCMWERELLLYVSCESLLYFSRELLLYSCVSLFSYEFVVVFSIKIVVVVPFLSLAHLWWAWACVYLVQRSNLWPNDKHKWILCTNMSSEHNLLQANWLRIYCIRLKTVMG